MDSKHAELPPPNTKRWVVRRKAAVVAAVRAGVITLEEACRRYEPTASAVYAPRGFRITVIRIRRDPSSGGDLRGHLAGEPAITGAPPAATK